MSSPATPQWTARDPMFRSVVRRTVARRLAIIGLLALIPVAVEAITVTTTFDDLSANNSFNNQINSPYQSGDFNFASGGAFPLRREASGFSRLRLDLPVFEHRQHHHGQPYG
jgi:hypothetical protein